MNDREFQALIDEAIAEHERRLHIVLTAADFEASRVAEACAKVCEVNELDQDQAASLATLTVTAVMCLVRGVPSEVILREVVAIVREYEEGA